MNLKEETIKLKLLKAKSIIKEIEVLMENKFYTTVVSRLYYSCFHATKALLLTKDLSPKTHKGTSAILHQHFVNKGSFDKEKAIFFDGLMKERIEDDYNDFMISNQDEVTEFINPAKEYVDYVSQLIEKYLKEYEGSNPDEPNLFP